MNNSFSSLPAVDRVLNFAALQPLIEEHGRAPVLNAVRVALDAARAQLRNGEEGAAAFGEDWFAERCRAQLEIQARPSLRPVFNLTGTVLHTNLGRALLPLEAQQAALAVMGQPANLEYDLQSGARGERDEHIEPLLRELTGAEAAIVVNNNAAAVFLVLNTLALKKEVPVSRGELIEIGGAFRIPDIMRRAGCKLIETGTTNRTHLRDFEEAINSRTAMLMKVHASNYQIQGFTATVAEKQLGALAHKHNLPLMVDLGSGTLIDFADFGLPAEPTPQQALSQGADIVTFSGDKLLGGPQAGLIVGKKELLKQIRKNPLKRALRVDKITLAMLEAVLRLYRDPERLRQRLPTLRLLTRRAEEIDALAQRLLPVLQKQLAGIAVVAVKPCRSQVGSGSLPVETLPSICIVITPPPDERHPGTWLEKIAAAFRALPVPVIGRMEDGAFCLDLRCLEDEQKFTGQLAALKI
ncbi:MAG: L-seryl-tRNA(Sec) selenium transferase [Burkholderiales bacterium]